MFTQQIQNRKKNSYCQDECYEKNNFDWFRWKQKIFMGYFWFIVNMPLLFQNIICLLLNCE